MGANPGDELLAEFCAELPTLRRALRHSAGKRAILEQAAEAARRGEPVEPLLRRLGYRGVEPPTSTPAGPARGGVQGGGLPTPVDRASTGVAGVYVCPAGICGRVVVRPPGGVLPSCHLHQRDFRFVPDA